MVGLSEGAIKGIKRTKTMATFGEDIVGGMNSDREEM
jgi:hypothetical protein